MTTESIHNLILRKYPRTAHLEGSRLQEGDDGSDQLSYAKLAGRFIVVEEKLDGGNSGIGFSDGGQLLLQSRGHYLAGGGRERQFNLFKRWAAAHEDRLLDRLEDRYVAFGEWLHKKHAIFYDRLPHYWCEFDIWDRSREVFLGTPERAAILGKAPVLPVPVLFAGIAPPRLKDLLALVQHSYAKSGVWADRFEQTVMRENLDLKRAWKGTDKSRVMEGLYIKVEENGVVTERYKWIRRDFVQAIEESGQHHAEQPFIPNQLDARADIYASELTLTWEDLGLTTLTEL